jgi:hypothetical protein
MNDNIEEPIAARRRFARGPKRPKYMNQPELDNFMMMFNALLTEFSAMKDRLDTHELLGNQGQAITTENVERFELSLSQQAARESGREAMLNRVFRILLEEREQARDAISTRKLEEVLIEDGGHLPPELRSDN